MTIWEIRGCSAAALPADWRQQLAVRLGQRPRRIGVWAELALSGALSCLDAAGETALPESTLLSVCSLTGPEPALLAALASARHELPLPIGFLQGQPGQVLPVLAQHLGWQGNGRCLATRDPVAALRLACIEAAAEGEGGILLGWVDQLPAERSLWLRATPRPDAGSGSLPLNGSPADFAALFRPDVRSFGFGHAGGLLLA